MNGGEGVGKSGMALRDIKWSMVWRLALLFAFFAFLISPQLGVEGRGGGGLQRCIQKNGGEQSALYGGGKALKRV